HSLLLSRLGTSLRLSLSLSLSLSMCLSCAHSHTHAHSLSPIHRPHHLFPVLLPLPLVPFLFLSLSRSRCQRDAFFSLLLLSSFLCLLPPPHVPASWPRNLVAALTFQ